MVSKREKIAAAIIVIDFLSKKQKKPRSVWERKWIQRRKLHGAYNALSRELRMEDPSQLRNFIRMSAEDFEELSSWIAPMVQKMDTNMRQAISVGERLMLTLRFLATGNNKATTILEYRYFYVFIFINVYLFSELAVFFYHFYYILGDSYASLSYLFRIPANTICGIVPEVCQALSDVLQEKGFLKVLKILLQFTTNIMIYYLNTF